MSRVPHPTKSRHAAMTYREPFLVRAGRYSMSGGLIIGLLVILYVAAWFFTAMSLRSGLQDWFDARKVEGYLAQYDDKKARISGFPFQVRASLKGVTLGAPGDEKGNRPWVWSPKQVDFEITPLPWTVSTLDVHVKSRQTLVMGERTYEGQAKKLNLSINWLTQGLPDDLSFEIEAAAFENVQSNHRFDIKTLSLRAERLGNENYAFDVNGEQVGLPLGIKGMGTQVSDLVFRGEFTEKFGRTGLGIDGLSQWRDAGGTLEASRIQVEYGPLLIQGNGTMALDGNLQPVGAFSARIQGFFDTVDRLRRGGVIRGPDASMAKVVLGMLSKQPSNGGRATISLPISIQDRGLYAGPVRLIELSEIHW